MRLRENGLLRRQDRTNAIINLLHVMARTPAGSWAGSPSFGLRDLFESRESRADIPRLAMLRINETFKELGLGDFVVAGMTKEPSSQKGLDQYAITIQSNMTDERFSTSVVRQI